MPEMTAIIAFAMIALGLVLTPGPNMVYLISRSINQGRAAGMISLAGVVAGFLFYMLCAVFGITVLLLAVPYAYETLKFAGRCICFIWRGRRLSLMVSRHLKSKHCHKTALINCL